MRPKGFAVFTCAVALVTLLQFSKWWEIAFATPGVPRLSPDKCLRLESYRPFWILPSILQINPPSNRSESADFGAAWQAPGFYRAIEESTGRQLGQSIVFDGFMISGPADINWGTWDDSGRRTISVGGYLVANTNRCSEESARLTVLRYERSEGEFNPLLPRERRSAPPDGT